MRSSERSSLRGFEDDKGGAVELFVMPQYPSDYGYSDFDPSVSSGSWVRQGRRVIVASAIFAALFGTSTVSPATALPPDSDTPGGSSYEEPEPQQSSGDHHPEPEPEPEPEPVGSPFDTNDAGFGDDSNETNSNTTEPNNNFNDSDSDDEPQTISKPAPAATTEPVAATPEVFHSYDEVGIDVPSRDLDRSEDATPATESPNMFSAFSDFMSSVFKPAAEVVDAPASSYDEIGINVYSGDVIDGTDLDDIITVNDGKYNRQVVISTDGVEQNYFMARQQGEGVTVNGRAGNDTIFGTAFNDTLNGGTGDDHTYGFGGDDTISGGAGDDVVYGGHGKDSLNGDDGNDYLSGGPDDDTLRGGVGKDILTGGLDDDELDGGLDGDVVIGGPGADAVAKSDFDDGDLIYVSTGDEINRSEKDKVVEFEPVALENLTLDAPGPDEASVLSSDLTTLGSIPSGGELTRRLNETGRPVTVIHVPESETMVPGAYRPNEDGTLRPDGTPGPGSDPAVWNTFMTNELSGTNLSVITLGHELIHAEHIANGTENPGLSVELDGNGDALLDPVTGDVVFTLDSELQVVGLPYDQDGNRNASVADPQTPSLADELKENLHNVTENSIRADLALPQRENYNTSVDLRFEQAGLIPRNAEFSAPNASGADPQIDGGSVPTAKSLRVDESTPTAKSVPIVGSMPAISFTYEKGALGQRCNSWIWFGSSTCRPARSYWDFGLARHRSTQ